MKHFSKYLISNAKFYILGQKAVVAPAAFALSRMAKTGERVKEGEEVLFECSLHAIPAGLTQFKWLFQLAGESTLTSFTEICSDSQLACRTVYCLISRQLSIERLFA